MLSYVSPGVPGVKGEKGDKGVGEMGDSGHPGAPGLTPKFSNTVLKWKSFCQLCGIYSIVISFHSSQVFLVLLVTVRWDHQALLVSRASPVFLDLRDHLERRARMVVVTRQTV